jgi:hypothetical protein
MSDIFRRPSQEYFAPYVFGIEYDSSKQILPSNEVEAQ